MNRKMVFYLLGQIITLEGLLLVLPAIVSVIYREQCLFSFLITIAFTLIVGAALVLIFKPTDRTIYAKEGFIVVALAWLAMSLFGALPAFISGEIPSFADSFFETVSGFSTTGASILTNVEELSKGILFWRSFTHWIGGMGVLVMIMALMPSDSGRAIHLIRAEMPGHSIGKLVPKIKTTAKILYLIYIAMTAVEIILLLAGGMPLFESIVHTFGTAGTGGLSVKADSMTGYSNYLQWVIAIFMLLFGVNFNLYYFILCARVSTALKSSELWVYIGIVCTSIACITFNILPLYSGLSEAFKHSTFQVSSIISTTGYTTANYDAWPQLSKSILFILMFIGGCSGSTAGGLKISRVMLLFNMIRSNLKQMIHPRSLVSVQFEGKKVDSNTTNGVGIYFAAYAFCIVTIFLLISFEPFDLETIFASTIACFNNIGAGFGTVGPAGSYAPYTAFSKIVLSIGMLLGRLEIYPLLFLFSRRVWSKRTSAI